MNVKTIITTITVFVLITLSAAHTIPCNQPTKTEPTTKSSAWQPLTQKEVIKAHREGIIKLKAITDQCFASVSYDCAIKFWDSKTKQCVAEINEPNSIIFGFTPLSPTIVACGTNNGVVDIMNIQTGQWVFSADWLNNGKKREPVWALEALDAETLAVSTYNDKGSPCYVINIWHTPTMELQSAIRAHEDKCTALQKIGTNLLASGSYDHTIKIWDTKTGKHIKTLTGHRGGVTSLALLCPGILVSASDDCSIKIWDIASGVCLKTLNGHTRPINAIATTADNLIASTNYNTIKIWDAVNASCLQTIELKEGALPGLTFINPRQGPVRLACGSDKGTITIFEGSTH